MSARDGQGTVSDDEDEVGTRDKTAVVAAERALKRKRNPAEDWGEWSSFHESMYEKMRAIFGGGRVLRVDKWV